MIASPALPPSQPKQLRLCIVGPLRHHRWCEIFAELFAREGYPVVAVSKKLNRYQRLFDIIVTLIRRRRDIDVLCLNTYGGRSFVIEDLASWLARRFGHRVVMILHGGAMPKFTARFPRWSRRVFQRVHAFVAPSPFLAKMMAQAGLRARVIPNVINLPDYPYRHRSRLKPRLFWMHAFHPIYNPQMAVRVLERVRASFPDATLVMAGQSKGLQEHTERLAAELGLKDAVRFPGYLDLAGKAREGDAADIFLHTKHVDNMPVGVVEACAMGLPAVATRVGGVPDLRTDGETGLLVTDGDEQAMAAAIHRLLMDPELAGRLSANGRKLAESSEWQKVLQQWQQLFAELLDERVASHPRAVSRRTSGMSST